VRGRLAAVTGRPLAVAPEAQALADCVRISLLAPSPVPADELIKLADDAFAPAG
jgi:hypothetical protein